MVYCPLTFLTCDDTLNSECIKLTFSLKKKKAFKAILAVVVFSNILYFFAVLLSLRRFRMAETNRHEIVMTEV